MEKRKRRRIIFNVVNAILMIAVFGAAFAISVSTGIAAICFSALGALFAYHAKTLKIQREFFNRLIENREDLLNGKIITLTANEDEVSVMISEPEKEKKSAKKTKEAVS